MVSLRRATADDISFIMATERSPGYDVLVGCFEEDVHRANLADDSWLYFIGLDASGTPQGFAVLQNRHDGDGSEFLRRFAVANPGGRLWQAVPLRPHRLDFHALGQRALSSACPE